MAVQRHVRASGTFPCTVSL